MSHLERRIVDQRIYLAELLDRPGDDAATMMRIGQVCT
jgi:hypothetical protein